MADDFEAVPQREWWRISDRASDALWIGIGALALVILLIMTLIQKGYISGWSELLDLNRVRAPGG